MSDFEKTTLVRGIIPPKVHKDFAGARGLVQRAVRDLPRSVSFSEALAQVRTFSKAVPKK